MNPKTGEMAQWLWTLVALAQNLDLVPNAYMATKQPSIIPVRPDALSWKNIQTHEIK